MVFEYEDTYPAEYVRDAKVCLGLAHPARWLALKILKENGGRMTLKSMLDILQSEYSYKQTYVRLKHHLEQMEEAGIVRIIDPKTRKKLIEVELLLDVSIDIKEVKKDVENA